ncbi:uncharacterized protein LOC122196043 [Lactuca sativa]|uniref:uncharacterized protein LOC122196043 n=1 Tax=Lactuca sativa TaxID=4236 RepID=UPI001C691E0A|nr:uncharacterized protein LOC122196043 [Lactuca sativa]
MEKRLLNASSGRSLPDKTPTEIHNLIKNMVEDSKHSSHDEEWYTDAPRATDKGVQPTPRPCGIFTQVGHPTDMCPQLQEEDYEEEKATGGHSGSNQRGYDQPRGDQTWNNNQGWGGNHQGSYQPNQPHQYQQRPPFPPQNFQPRKLESQGKLPAQTETNPRHNVCAITLRGGKSYNDPKVSVDQQEEEIAIEEETKEEKKEDKTIQKKSFVTESKATPTPFPERLKSTKKEREESDIMQMFQKVHINIPLLEAIKHVPRYARFLKDLFVSNKKSKGNQIVTVGENVSTVLQKRMPLKCKDPGVFTVPCKLGNLDVPRDMLDLDMGYDESPSSSSILLGRSFLKTSKTKIDVYNGSLIMEFDGEVINFNVYEAKKVPSDV